jgi:hypothetical protein
LLLLLIVQMPREALALMHARVSPVAPERNGHRSFF